MIQLYNYLISADILKLKLCNVRYVGIRIRASCDLIFL